MLENPILKKESSLFVIFLFSKYWDTSEYFPVMSSSWQKLEYFSKTVKEASFSDSLEHHFNDEFIITEITYSTLMSNLKNGNEISITYRKRKSSEIFIGVGVLKTIAHNRIEYYDKEQLEINAINFSYINSIKIISRWNIVSLA